MKLELTYKAKRSGQGITVSLMRRQLARLVSKLPGDSTVNKLIFTLSVQKNGFRTGD